MIQSPTSLTAVVHIKFHYGDAITKPVGEKDIEMISQILDKASGLDPELQGFLVRFADYLSQVTQGKN